MKRYLLAGCLLLLGGPVGGPRMAAEAAQASHSAANSAIWIDVPFVAQTPDGCGSASISMVMQYWDRKQRHAIAPDAEPEHIQAALFSHAARGIFASGMQKYFERSGYRAFAFSGRWSDFEHQLALGRPMIVGIHASGPMGPLHYVVIVGIDPERNYLFMNDPAQQKMLRISREGFESEWRATHHWTLLAVPQTTP